ncbi:MAG: hypothetical protein MUQ27_02745 [Acidimicrobiia bacterium]|nr:hypothetical protein [Acidimicrobiia bacterium]
MWYLTGFGAKRARSWASASSHVGGVFIVLKVRIHRFLLRMWFMSLIVVEDPVIS